MATRQRGFVWAYGSKGCESIKTSRDINEFDGWSSKLTARILNCELKAERELEMESHLSKPTSSDVLPLKPL